MNIRQRMLILGFIDAGITLGAVIAAYFLRFDFTIQPVYWHYLPNVIILQIILVLVCFHGFKIYHHLWQYASLGEAISIIKAVTVAETAFYILYKAIQSFDPSFLVPRSIFLLSWMLIIGGIGASRFSWRLFRDSYFHQEKAQNRTLIVGAGSAGYLVAKELKQSTAHDMSPVAFIDDDKTKQSLEILGLPVLGGRNKIPAAVKKYDISTIVIAIPSAPRREIAKIIEICKQTKANLRILPRVSDLINGKFTVKMIRDVNVEDLLGRDPVQVDLQEISGYITNHVVLVTGAGGSIGSELSRQIASFEPQKLLLLGHGENSIYEIETELRRTHPHVKLEAIIADIQDRMRIKEIFQLHRPHVVFHAAAHKHVPLMEMNPAEAVKNNILGTKNVAECAHEFASTHFVMISTDKAVNPTSVMGATKRVAEMIIQGMDRFSPTKFVAVRFGNVLGSRGSVIPVFKRQIQMGGPVTVTHPDMVRYFMTIPEAVQLVIQAGALAKGGEIFILDMGEPMKIVDLARNLIRLSGLEPDKDIQIVFTGIRPGEKLFEEILTNEEGISATKHQRIFIGKPMDFSWEKLQHQLQALEKRVTQESQNPHADEIKDLLARMVPTYQRKPPVPLQEQKEEYVQAVREIAVSKQ